MCLKQSSSRGTSAPSGRQEEVSLNRSSEGFEIFLNKGTDESDGNANMEHSPLESNVGSDCSNRRKKKKTVRFESVCQTEYVPSRSDLSLDVRRKIWLQQEEDVLYKKDFFDLAKKICRRGRYGDFDTFISSYKNSKSGSNKEQPLLLVGNGQSKKAPRWYEEGWVRNSGHTSRGMEEFTLPKTCKAMDRDRTSVINFVIREQKRFDEERLAKVASERSKRALMWAMVKAARDEYDARCIQSPVKSTNLALSSRVQRFGRLLKTGSGRLLSSSSK